MMQVAKGPRLRKLGMYMILEMNQRAQLYPLYLQHILDAGHLLVPQLTILNHHLLLLPLGQLAPHLVNLIHDLPQYPMVDSLRPPPPPFPSKFLWYFQRLKAGITILHSYGDRRVGEKISERSGGIFDNTLLSRWQRALRPIRIA